MIKHSCSCCIHSHSTITTVSQRIAQVFAYFSLFFAMILGVFVVFRSYQEWGKEYEGCEVNYGEMAPTRTALRGGIAVFARVTGQHNHLPTLSRRTSRGHEKNTQRLIKGHSRFLITTAYPKRPISKGQCFLVIGVCFSINVSYLGPWSISWESVSKKMISTWFSNHLL